jgi:hypothetical protein
MMNHDKEKDKHETVQVVYELGHYDVLLGRGAGSINYVGNVLFREIVKERRDEYLSTSKRQSKDAIAREILEAVAARKGRFLRKIVTDDERKHFGIGESDNAWIVADDEKTLEKVKQSLRDREYSPGEGDCVKSDSTHNKSIKKESSLVSNEPHGHTNAPSSDRLTIAENMLYSHPNLAFNPSATSVLLQNNLNTNPSQLNGILQHLQSPNMNSIATMLLLNPHLLSLVAGNAGNATQLLSSQQPMNNFGTDPNVMLQLQNRVRQQSQQLLHSPSDIASLLIRQQQEILHPNSLGTSSIRSEVGRNKIASPNQTLSGMFSAIGGNKIIESKQVSLSENYKKKRKPSEDSTGDKERKKQKAIE